METKNKKVSEVSEPLKIIWNDLVYLSLVNYQLSTWVTSHFFYFSTFTSMSIIQQKSRSFAIRIINCYKFLTEEKHEQILSKQLLRCGTSIGANTRESKNAQSRMDFLSKLNIALKEADETEYWLDLLHETKYLDDNLYKSINDDCAELIKILTAIIKKIKEDSKKK